MNTKRSSGVEGRQGGAGLGVQRTWNESESNFAGDIWCAAARSSKPQKQTRNIKAQQGMQLGATAAQSTLKSSELRPGAKRSVETSDCEATAFQSRDHQSTSQLIHKRTQAPSGAHRSRIRGWVATSQFLQNYPLLFSAVQAKCLFYSPLANQRHLGKFLFLIAEFT